MLYENLYIPGNFNTPDTNYDFYHGPIIPKSGIENGKAFQITHIDESYHLKGFCITRYNNRLAEVKLYGKHPNANLNTRELCLPDYLKGAEVLDIEHLKVYLIWMLEQFCLDECYYQPAKKLYKRKSVDAQGKPIVVNFEKGTIKYE